MDLFFTDTPGVVAGNASSLTGTSNHFYASAIINTKQTVSGISFSHKTDLKSQAHWDGILTDLHKFDWADIYRQVDYAASMNDAFERIIVKWIPLEL